MHEPARLLVSENQLWVFLIGAIVPLGGYVINHLAPWVDEKVKAVVQVILAAVATALYTALATSVFGLNTETLQLVASGVVAALAAHNWLWRPSGINTELGAGHNR
jgi:VIT1/CCC1 family predicted Fe2+/Mn2+ transporter